MQETFETAEAAPSPMMAAVLEFCDEAEIVAELDDEDPTYAGLDIEGTGVWVYDSSDEHALLLFLPLLEPDLPAGEAEEGCRLLAERFPIPEEFDGLAAYDFAEFGRGGMLIVLPMPRRFSAPILADGLELIAETIARVSAGMGDA